MKLVENMIPEWAKKQWYKCGEMLTGSYRVAFLLFFASVCHIIHILVYPFPSQDSLTYLRILHDWNQTGSFSQVLEKFPKFALLLFSFLPLKWAEQCGITLFPASIIWMFLMSMVSVYALYKITLLLTGDVKKAMWCGAMLAVLPMILFYAGNLLRDTPYLMFCLLLMLCFIYAIRSRTWYFFLLNGVTLAMCLLSRFEAWEMLLFFPLFSIFYMIKYKFGKWKATQFILLSAAGFLGTLILMFMAIDDLAFLYEKIRWMFLLFLPEWMGVR